MSNNLDPDQTRWIVRPDLGLTLVGKELEIIHVHSYQNLSCVPKVKALEDYMPVLSRRLIDMHPNHTC